MTSVDSVLRYELPRVSLVDSVIFGERDWLPLSLDEQYELRCDLLREAFRHHLENCPDYERFARSRGVGPDDIATPADLAAIPQFPTSVFKHRTLLSTAAEEIVLSFTSSGTSGAKSTVGRDTLTLQRLCGMIRADSPLFAGLFDGMDDTNALIINLGVSRRGAGDVWFGYVMSLLEQVAPMNTYLEDGRLDVRGAVRDTAQALAAGDRVLIAGPPFLVADFCRATGSPLNGGSRLTVFTGGGWKNREAERIGRREFTDLVRAACGIADAGRVRDVFNQVELNTLLVECERQHKHVPPWVHVVARDPAGFAPLADGETGVLAFSDASAASYPCFFIGDDLGRVVNGRCDCGREGTVLHLERRLRHTSHEGCADTLSRRLVPA